MSGAWLITGARGFIGSALMQALGRGAVARALIAAGRSREGIDPVPGSGWAELDLSASTIDVPAGVETVLHLAGEKRDIARMQAVNVAGSVRLVEAAARAGARRFIHLSSVGVYGAPKHSGRVDERHPRTPKNPYELSKDAGERAVRERCAALGLRCIVLQPGTVLGVVPGRSYPLLGLARMIARGWYRHVGRSDACVNYVAVDDVAAALIAAAADDSAEGVFIVNTPAPLASVTGWIAEELGVAAPTGHIPLWAGAVAATIGGVGRRLLKRELAFGPERFLELTNTTCFDGSALTRALGFEYPLGIDAALRGMVRSYRAAGLV
jgi:UDP-glucose 4-epimerase